MTDKTDRDVIFHAIQKTGSPTLLSAIASISMLIGILSLVIGVTLAVVGPSSMINLLVFIGVFLQSLAIFALFKGVGDMIKIQKAIASLILHSTSEQPGVDTAAEP